MTGSGSKGQATRQSILRAAAAQFRQHGYGASTLDEIAHTLGITRAAVLYHFSTKEDILEGVVGPYLGRLAAVLARYGSAADATPAVRRRLVVEFVDATIAEYLAAGILFRDVTSWDQPMVRDRVEACNTAFREALTGPEPTTELRALATCLLGALVRPLIDPALEPSDPEVRAAILDVTFAVMGRIDRVRRGRHRAAPESASPLSPGFFAP